MIFPRWRGDEGGRGRRPGGVTARQRRTHVRRGRLDQLEQVPSRGRIVSRGGRDRRRGVLLFRVFLLFGAPILKPNFDLREDRR